MAGDHVGAGRGRATAAVSTAATHPLSGIALLIVSGWALSGLDSSAKWAMGGGVSLIVLGWLRYTVHLLLVLAVAVPAHGWKILRTRQPRAQMLRGLAMLMATLCFFSSLVYLPLAEATAINFLAPLIMLSVAPWLLKEPPRMSRWVAAAVGFAGVLIVVRPGSGLPLPGVALGLLTACFFAAQHLLTRRMASEPPLTTLIWSGLVGSVFLTLALPFALPELLAVLPSLDWTVWLACLGAGFWGMIGHLLQIHAYQRAPASMLAPFLYLQIFGAATLGWLLWGQFPDGVTWLGIAVICASGASIALLEWRRARGRPRAV